MYRNLIDLSDFTKDEIQEIIKMGREFHQNRESGVGTALGKLMATLFYEPSTRTMLSFQAAMQRLSGSVVGFDNPQNSSVSKGENFKDTIEVVSSYSDILVIRHPSEGAAAAAALYSNCPVVNAGDGGHLHPTQTLTDLLTLDIELSRVDNLKIGICGDLKNGRTVHSLAKELSDYQGNSFVFISTKALSMPQYILDILDEKGVQYNFADSIEDVISELDILYMTRIQKERFATEEEYKAESGKFILDERKMELAKDSFRILHPLPRVDEIDVAVDSDKRAAYFRQAEYGMYVRMALCKFMMAKKSDKTEEMVIGTTACDNERCITADESYLPNLKTPDGNCAFCERPSAACGR